MDNISDIVALIDQLKKKSAYDLLFEDDKHSLDMLLNLSDGELKRLGVNL